MTNAFNKQPRGAGFLATWLATLGIAAVLTACGGGQSSASTDGSITAGNPLGTPTPVEAIASLNAGAVPGSTGLPNPVSTPTGSLNPAITAMPLPAAMGAVSEMVPVSPSTLAILGTPPAAITSTTGSATPGPVAGATSGTAPMGSTAPIAAPLAAGFGAASATASTGAFTFATLTKSTVSAGVFTTAGTLVRTLWNNKVHAAGTHSAVWDGKDDFGRALPSSTAYTVKLLANNIAYKWEGVVGNSSPTSTGSGLHHGYDLFHTVAISGNTAYVAKGYDEAAGTKYKINLAAPQSKSWILPSGQGTTQFTSHVATDGATVYWAEFDPYDTSHYWVHATSVATDTPVAFSAGAPHTPVHSIYYPSVIDNSADPISGLAVSGNYVFVAHSGSIKVFAKASGALAQTLAFSSPKGLAVAGNSLWVINGTSVSKYPVNANGTLGSALLTLSGLVAPYAVADNGSLVAVVDGGESQQVKAFNSSTGAAAWTLGKPGGYATSAAVANDKFMFSPNAAYIAFQTDGSFWVGDPGNMRNQHFSANRAYIDNIAYLAKSYNNSVDMTNPQRVFSHGLEFRIDYTKPLAPNNGSWTLVNNFRYHDLPIQDEYNLSGVTTLGNGRTYSLVRMANGGQNLVELTPAGLRLTGTPVPPQAWLEADGSISSQQGIVVGERQRWYQQLAIGFDSRNDIVLAPATTPELTPVTTALDPIGYPVQKQTTSTGVSSSFDYNIGTGYHLAGVKNGAWTFRTALATHAAYRGPFPTDGFFDIGNGVNTSAGTSPRAIDRSIFWGFHGEFWKGGQANVWNHFYDNGLMLGQFGTSKGSYQEGYPAMAGNAFSVQVVKVGTDYYLYHNDESYHSGVHRFRISGLDTIAELSVPILVPSSFAPTVSDSLMAGLPFNAVLPTGNGWTRSAESTRFTALTSRYTYNQFNGDDIFMVFGEGEGSKSVSRTLGSNAGLTSWTLSGKVSWDASVPNYANGGGGVFLQLLDANGKAISNFYYQTSYGPNATAQIVGNGAVIASDGIEVMKYNVANDFNDLSIALRDGKIVFTYAGFAPVAVSAVAEAGANVGNPTTLRVLFLEDRVVRYGSSFDIANLRFVK